MISNTLHIFRQLYTELPPLVPEEIKEKMEQALDQLEHNPHLTLIELEDVMISFGKKIWPYRKAFYEILATYEGKMGETLLLQNLSPGMKKKYSEFMAHGGTYRQFMAGCNACDFFDANECILLGETAVLVKNSIRAHARQAAVTSDKAEYCKKIEEFTIVQEKIESVFNELHNLADEEQEHPALATEIRAHVRGLEYGIAALGPHTQLSEVEQAVDYFAERKKYKQTL